MFFYNYSVITYFGNALKKEDIVVDLEKNKKAEFRYFAALAMLFMELDGLSDIHTIRGYTVRNVLKKYGVDIYADKKRCRVSLRAPKGKDMDFSLVGFHKQLLGGYREFKKKTDYYKTIAGDLK
jgi:hypothetical protein